MLENQGKSSTPIFVSLIPNLMGGEGHIIPYHQAVSQAVNKLGWKHLVAIPTNSNINDLPTEWEGYLSHDDLEAEGNIWQKILRLIGVYKLAITIAKYFKNNVINQSELSIIFLERFIHLQLLSLAIALWLVPTQNLSVWLLYRRDTHKDKTRFIYKFLNDLIKKRLPKGNFKLLTDSELLSQALCDYFQEKVTVMPIPHTDIKVNNLNKNEQSSEILCWWAGFPREEKGWSKIQALVNTSIEDNQKICLIAAKNANLIPIETGLDVKLIENQLTREEYNYWFSISDVILLPYNSDAYGERTSGIFTECIIAGKIPLVTDQTWMSYELLKYDLGELIINWESPQQVFLSILDMTQDNNIKNKIQAMQNSYQNFHCINSYADTMQKLINEK